MSSSSRGGRRVSTAAGLLAAAVSLATLGVAGCSADGAQAERTPTTQPVSSSPSKGDALSPSPTTVPNVYAAAGKGALSVTARAARPMVYVPTTIGGTVELIDPRTYRVVGRFKDPGEPQHVVPSWDQRTLWVNADHANTLTPINPRTGRAGRPVPVEDPYNLYFTPDGRHALVMAERLQRIDVRDPHTLRLQRSLKVPCHGINHADFTADLSLMVASCEFDGTLVVTDRNATRVRSTIDLNRIATPGATSPQDAMQMPGSPKNGLRPGASAMPQDVRLTPDGQHFVVADMLRNGIWVVDAKTLRVSRFLHTGLGAHGIYPSRDARRLYVSNRDAGTVSVLDASALRQVALWRIPGGGSPDMGGVTADGSELWLAGRYDNVVYVFDTRTGRVTHRIPVDAGPHGLAVWPQPGRFSLGHTGNMR